MSESVSGYDLTAAGTQDNQERVVGKDCVRKHRNKLRDQDCTRLDLWVEGPLFDDLCTLAIYRHVPLRLIVQEAFKDAVLGY
jgi:hypothetical protein